MSAADRAYAEAEAQGLPATVTDPSVLERVAALLTATAGNGAGDA